MKIELVVIENVIVYIEGVLKRSKKAQKEIFDAIYAAGLDCNEDRRGYIERTKNNVKWLYEAV